MILGKLLHHLSPPSNGHFGHHFLSADGHLAAFPLLSGKSPRELVRGSAQGRGPAATARAASLDACSVTVRTHPQRAEVTAGESK